MVRTIITVPAEILRTKSRDVENPTAPEIAVLIQDLKDSCVAAEGVGLAAPQIGVAKRVIVVHYGADAQFALINPEIARVSTGTSVLEEGCLSIPDVTVPVPRPTRVTVRALGEDGELVEIKASDFLAKVLQHEIDHLNGVLITDYRQEDETAVSS